WESYEAHQRVTNHASCPDVIAIFKPCQGRKIRMYHVQFSAPTIAFEKPVTDVLVLTLKAPENRATVVDILSKLSEASQKMLVFGQTVEGKNKYIVVGGWPTVNEGLTRSFAHGMKCALHRTCHIGPSPE
ncbi:hypothetical protein PAXINDRAFT_87875, partial [Paxillus involutus ATCC 200175]